jgi:hypothetical protein
VIGRSLQKRPAYLGRPRFEQFRPVALDVADTLGDRPEPQHIFWGGAQQGRDVALDLT